MPGAQHGHGTALQVVRLCIGAWTRLALWIGGVEETLPLLAAFELRQHKGNGFMMGVHQQQDGIAYYRITSLVQFSD